MMNMISCGAMQAQHDYLAGNYPVVREDAAQMCALQMQAEAGPTMLDSADSLENAIERFIHKQVWRQPYREFLGFHFAIDMNTVATGSNNHVLCCAGAHDQASGGVEA